MPRRSSSGSIASLGVLAYAIGKFPSGWLADFLGGKRSFLHRNGGRGSLHHLVCHGWRHASFHPRLDGESLHPVDRLGRHGQDHLALVLLLGLRNSHGGGEPQLPVRRRSVARIHGPFNRRRFRMAGYFFHRGRRLSVCCCCILCCSTKRTTTRVARTSANQQISLKPREGSQNRPVGVLTRKLRGQPVFWVVCLLSFGVTHLRETFICGHDYFTKR